MSTFAVYNSCDSIDAHNILSMQSPDDVFSTVYPGCTASVKVDAASFREEYRGAGKLHKPYMEIMGSVGSLFFEDDDGRQFPCGARCLEMMQPQTVRIHYVLSSDELSDVVRMGLFSNAGDFDVPTNLVGNVIEIPVAIKYTGIYESPFAAVEVMEPGLVYTCTRDTCYFGLFNACQISAEIEAEKLENFEYYPHKDYSMYNSEQYVPENDFVQDQHQDQVSVQPVPSMQQDSVQHEELAVPETTREEQDSISAVQRLIEEHAKEAADRRAAMDARGGAGMAGMAIVDRVNRKLRERAESDELPVVRSGAIFGSDDTSDAKSVKPTYEDFKTAAMDIASETESAMSDDELSERDKAEKDADDVREQSSGTDRALDNQRMNQGSSDIAGFGTQVSDIRDLTPEQRKEVEEKKTGDAQRRVSRMQDIAADNLAMNRGITDIAGQGAGNVDSILPVRAGSEHGGNGVSGKQAVSASELVTGLLSDIGIDAADDAMGQDNTAGQVSNGGEQEYL